MNQKIFISSIPKSGTHLLASVVNLINKEYPISVTKSSIETFNFEKYKSRPCLLGHFRVNNINGNAKLKELILDRNLLILIRDPRDIVNSMVNFLPNSPNSYHKLLSKQLDGKSYQEQIIMVANGLKLENSDIEVSDIRRHCAGFVNFSSIAKTMHVIKYEDFFDGEIVEKIADIFNIEIEAANMYVSEAMSSKTKTKRKDGGRPYGWRTEFNQEIKDFFVKEYSDVILDLGYKLY